jgi:curved DNA-binding protein CbpA
MTEMSLQICKGLAKFDFTDYYAILGVPIGVDFGEIRKRYLKIARILHPDSRNEGESRQLASNFLSKLVNPAYKLFSQDRERNEYELLLRYAGQRVLAEKDTIILESEVAKALSQLGDLRTGYHQAVKQLAEQQYQNLERSVQIIEQLSELNLVYLLRGGEQSPTAPRSPAYVTSEKLTTPSASDHSEQMPSKPSPTSTQVGDAKKADAVDDFVQQYCRRAAEFMTKNSFQNAVKELRDALKIDPQNARCHSLLGTIYLKQNQLTMAKSHFNQALKSDPRDAQALEGKANLEKAEQKALRAKATKAPPAQPESRGLFGLFKGKK